MIWNVISHDDPPGGAKGVPVKGVSMSKPERAVFVQTGRLAIGVAAMVAAMFGVYAILGRLTVPVVCGGLYSGALGVANFFVMGLLVQRITDQVAERQRTEQEIADLSLQMGNRMKLSYNLRMFALFALLVLGIAVFKFDALASILAAVFPSVVIRVLQIMEAKKASDVKGSERP